MPWEQTQEVYSTAHLLRRCETSYHHQPSSSSSSSALSAATSLLFPLHYPPDTFPLSIFITLAGVNSEADELSSSPSSPPPPPSPPASSPSQALPAAGRLAPSCGPAAGARAGERGGEREGPGGRGRGLAPPCRPWGHRQQAVCLFVCFGFYIVITGTTILAYSLQFEKLRISKKIK